LRDIEHIGSAHDDAELETLKAVAKQRRVAGQCELDLNLGDAARLGGEGLEQLVAPAEES
jgi:hypothetical protein